MEEDNNTPLSPPYELKLDHQLKHEPNAKDFTIDVTTKIYKQGSDSDPSEEIFSSSTVHDFVYEDENCPEKVAFLEHFVNRGMVEVEAEFLLIDMILYVNYEIVSLDQDFKGVFSLMVEVRLLSSEPVNGLEQTQSQEVSELTEVNHAGLEQIQAQELPEPVEFNYAGLEQTRSQEVLEPVEVKSKPSAKTRGRRLKPKGKIQKARYKIGSDGHSMVLNKQVEACVLSDNSVEKFSQ